MTAIPNSLLAELARAAAERHPPRTPQRRAGAHAWAALITSPSLSAARAAIGSFGAAETQAAAVELLGRLAATEGTRS